MRFSHCSNLPTLATSNCGEAAQFIFSSSAPWGGDAGENLQKSGLTSADEAEDITFADFDSYVADRRNFFLERAPKDLKERADETLKSMSEPRTATSVAAVLLPRPSP